MTCPFRSNITEKDIDAQLMTSRVGCPPLDILIRTSGVKRLSDFLLWQVTVSPFSAFLKRGLISFPKQCCEDTQIHFVSTYWPDFGLWDFIPIILDYQRKVWSQQAEHSHSRLSDPP
jgi:ditrans,polycis-polyprenyl diphosphate synthase